MLRCGLIHSTFKAFGRSCRVFATASRSLHTSDPCEVYKSKHQDIELPKVTITELFLQNFNQYGQKVALIDAVTGRSLTFDQVKDAIWRIASGLAKQGYGKGDVLMMLSENSIDFILVLHAALSLGGVVTTCNYHYLTDSIVHQCVHSNVSYVYSSQLCADKTKEVIAKVANIKKVFVSGKFNGFVPIDHLLEDDGTKFPSHPVADPFDLALLPYSSGTTGLPKGVMISHNNLVATCFAIDVPGYFPTEAPDSQLTMPPFYHIYGLAFHCSLIPRKGITTVIMPGFEPKLFLESIQKYRIGMIHLVPPIISFLTRHDMVSKYDLSSLDRVMCGAAPLGNEIMQQFNERHPHCAALQGYGLTETSGVVSFNRRETSSTKPFSCGPIIPNTYVKIVDTEKRELPPGERGELCVKGPQIMMGYLNNPDATSQCVDSDGWFHTGDVAYLDEDGFLYVVDRVKELIKYKGLQVPPAELEDILCSHPCVADAAVVGIPDEEAGELPKAFVALKQSSKISLEELNTFINERVPSYKRLRGGIEFLSQIPRSPSGKILRKELKVQ